MAILKKFEKIFSSYPLAYQRVVAVARASAYTVNFFNINIAQNKLLYSPSFLFPDQYNFLQQLKLLLKTGAAPRPQSS
jgi:hypothetical protein